MVAQSFATAKFAIILWHHHSHHRCVFAFRCRLTQNIRLGYKRFVPRGHQRPQRSLQEGHPT